MKKSKRMTPNSLDVLYDKRDRALERVVAVWEKDETAGRDELSRALDALVLAHVAVTFEWASGPVK